MDNSPFEDADGSHKWYVVAGPLIAIIMLLFALLACYVKHHFCMKGLQALTQRSGSEIPSRSPSRQQTDRLPAPPPQAGQVEQVEMGEIRTAAEEAVGPLASAPIEMSMLQVPLPYEYATLAEISPRHCIASYLEPGHLPMTKYDVKTSGVRGSKT